MAALATGPGKGGGLLEKPVIEKGTPGRESEFDLRYANMLIVAIFKCKFYNWETLVPNICFIN